MNNKPARIFFAFIAAAAVSMIIIELTVATWPFEHKIILPLAIVITGLIKLLTDIFKTKKKPAPASAAPPATPAEPAPPRNETGSKAINFFVGLVFLCFWIIVLATMVWAGIWLYNSMRKDIREIINSSHEIKAIEPLPIGHSNNQQVDFEKDLWLVPGTVYDAFTLEQGQQWKWSVLSKDIYYRVKQTGQEEFSLIDREQNQGHNHSANYDGILQLKTEHRHTHVTVIRMFRTK